MSTRRDVCTKLLHKICCMRFREIILTMIIGISRSRSSKYYYQNKLGQYSLLESVISYNYKQSPCKIGLRRFMHRHCKSYIVSKLWAPLCNKQRHYSRTMYPQGICETCSYQVTGRSKKGTCPFPPAYTGCPSEWRILISVQWSAWPLMGLQAQYALRIRHQLLDKENQTHIIFDLAHCDVLLRGANFECLSPRVGGALKLHLDTWEVCLNQQKHPSSGGGWSWGGSSRRWKMTSVGRCLQISGLRCCSMSHLRKMLRSISRQLTNGGEFITHWWALLTHTGILERPPRNVNNDIENPWEGSSYGCPSTTQATVAVCATNQQPMTGNHTVQCKSFSFFSFPKRLKWICKRNFHLL